MTQPAGSQPNVEAIPRESADVGLAAILLDTTVLIDLLRGRGGARSRLLGLRDRGDEAWACAVNVEEVFRGLRSSEITSAQNLISGLRIAPLGASEGRRAGAWRRDFAAEGTTLAQADCLIAAAAVGVKARLATGNPKHFPMAEVGVDHWPAGES
ncbi:MAG: PIN domain-containing protein [Actinomycetota bacterium]|nr:PIN domain-containing protein [Actinomycetota bacterium]